MNTGNFKYVHMSLLSSQNFQDDALRHVLPCCLSLLLILVQAFCSLWHKAPQQHCAPILLIPTKMMALICRVNLIGGAQANGTATDIAVVFTPAKAADRQLYMYNLTLPHGFFSRSPLGATDLFKSKLHTCTHTNTCMYALYELTSVGVSSTRAQCSDCTQLHLRATHPCQMKALWVAQTCVR